MIGRRLVVLIFNTVAALAVTSAIATAGTYTTYSCRTPSGHVATTEGWTQDLVANSFVEEFGTVDYGTNQCDQSVHKLLMTGLGDGHSWWAGDRVSMVYSAPRNTTIGNFSAAVCGVPGTTGAAASITWTGPSFNSPGGFRAQYGEQLGCSSSTDFTYLTAAGVGAPSLWFSASCTSTPCRYDPPGMDYPHAAPTQVDHASSVGGPVPPPCLMATCWSGGTDYLAVGSLVVGLRDDIPPAVTNVSGTLAGGGQHAGTESITFSATDLGGGVYRAVAQIRPTGAGDWQTVARTLVDVNGGKCVDAGERQTDDYEFAEPVPCKQSITDASLSVDTSQLPPGNSEFRAFVEDAGGNRTDVLSPRTFTVAGAGVSPSTGPDGALAHLAANNGIRASRTAFLRLRGTADRHLRYGQRVQLVGRLMDDHGRPIAGASLQVVGRVLLPDVGATGSWESIGAVVTDKRGRFVARLPAGVSRSVAVVYKANAADPGWTTNAQTDVLVSAGVTLRVRDSHVRNKHRVFFRGRVAGDIPKGGILVTLQVLGGSVWIPVATSQTEIHTKPNGRFKAAYKFQRTNYAASFRFRALAHRDSAFPFELGRSNGVLVHVTP